MKLAAVNLYVSTSITSNAPGKPACGNISLPAVSTAADANDTDPVNPVFVKSIVIKDGITDDVEKLKTLFDKFKSKFLVTATSFPPTNTDAVCSVIGT